MSWSLSCLAWASVLMASFVPWMMAACAWKSLRSRRQAFALISSATWCVFAAWMSCCISGCSPLRFPTRRPVGCPMILTWGCCIALRSLCVALLSSWLRAACGEATTISSWLKISSG